MLVGAGVGKQTSILHSFRALRQTAGGFSKQEQGPMSNDKVLAHGLKKSQKKTNRLQNLWFLNKKVE